VPTWDEVTGEWGGFGNEEHHDLYCLTNAIRVFESGRTCDTYTGEEKCIQNFFEEPWRK
jgi:hypothetical protein